MAVSQTLSVTEVSGSVDVSANTSQVRIRWLSTQTGDSWNGYQRTAKYYISINGGAGQEYLVSYTLPKLTTTTIVDKTITVTHKDDGTGTVRVVTWMDTGISAGVIEIPESINLTTIPRASTIESVSNRYLGENCSVRWTPLSNSFRYKLKFSMGNLSYTTNAIHPNQTSSYTYTGYPISLEAARQIPNSLTGTMTVTLYTYSDSGATKQVGSTSSKTFTVTVPDNANTKPYASTMTVSPVDSLGDTFAGLYLQSISKVKVSSTDMGQYGATIAWKSVEVEGKSYDSSTDYTSDYLYGYGDVNVKLTLTDSRGITNSQTTKISVIPYTKPRVVPITGERSVVCGRCDANGDWSDSGTYLKIKARRSYSLCMVNGVQKNFCGLRYRYKKATDSDYGDWIDLIPITDTTTEEVVTAPLLNGTLSTTTSYDVQVDAVDSINNHGYVPFDIPTDEVYLHKAGSMGSLGIGEYVEDENTISISKDKTILVKGNINGVRMRSKYIDASQYIDIQTMFQNFTGTEAERQTFFIFGEANLFSVYGIARVGGNGQPKWAGTDGVTLETKTDGVLTVKLPTIAYDIFTVISGQDFTL